MQVINIIKNLFMLLLVTMSTACSVSNKSLTGRWIEPIPGQNSEIHGITLNKDKTASSINTSYVQYESWERSGRKLILSGQLISDGKVIPIADTLRIDNLTADSLILTKGKRTWRYLRTSSTDMIKHGLKHKEINPQDSLAVQPELGSVRERQYSGLIPAEAFPGIVYTITLYGQEGNGAAGVYKMTANYIEADNGKDAVFTTSGRQYTEYGMPDDSDAIVYYLVSFDGKDEFRFMFTDGNLVMLEQEGKKINSQFKYTLNLASDNYLTPSENQ